jgi:signal transduction histidine kinase/transcriptional regulator with GAF, ATPase, and Fis domain
MAEQTTETERIRILTDLSAVPLLYSVRTEALKRITELGKEAMKSHTCTLALIDFDNRILTQVACTSSDKQMEDFMNGKEFPIYPNSNGHLDFDTLKRGEPIVTYNLQEDGCGVANSEIARRYNLHSLLSLPLMSDEGLIGYINHLSTDTIPFTEGEISLFEIFAHQTMITIKEFDQYQTQKISLITLNELTANLLSALPGDFLKIVSKTARQLLAIPICIVWEVDQTQNKLRVVASDGDVDDDYKRLELDLSDSRVQEHISPKKVSYISDVRKVGSKFVYIDEVKKRGWISLLSAPLWADEKFIGILDVFTMGMRRFKSWERASFASFANHAALSFQKIKLLEESEGRRKLEMLTDIMLRMTEVDDVGQLLEFFLQRGLELVGSNQGWISKLDYTTGDLNIVAASSSDLLNNLKLKLGTGITGKALKEEQAFRIGNVLDEKWEKIYVEVYKDTRSEMAIPLLVNNASIRVGRNVRAGSKPFGVLNVESPEQDAFSKTDEYCLLSLARYAALMVERLESERRSDDLRLIEDELIRQRDYNRVISIILKGIKQILGCEYVNISLVIPELRCIRPEHVFGIADSDINRFKKSAEYSLNSNTIQSEVIKSKEIEVSDLNDKNLDHITSKEFGIDSLMRVFVPMIDSSNNRVIGIIDAGYKKDYRKFIYEREVQILKRFADYASHAVQQRKSGLLDQIIHELRAPIVGIRGHASRLQLHHQEMEYNLVLKKFDDILSDCERLLYQVGELRYFLGRPRKALKLERTLVYRDVIIKTINQLRTEIKARGLDPSKIEYKSADSGRILVRTDKFKLNQVVYNLLENAIKYAEKDSKAFTIRIELDETKDSYIVKFKDWGIGIKKEYEDKIFKEGFRTPDAMKRGTGSGLGLAISKRIMLELGGDLKLTGLYKPTELQMIIPKGPRR